MSELTTGKKRMHKRFIIALLFVMTVSFTAPGAYPQVVYAADTIVDNTDAGFSVISGAWSTSTISPGYYGADYRTSPAGTGTRKVRWTPTVAEAAEYNVYVWYTSAANRASNAPYTIHHSGGSDTVRISQIGEGSQWVLLGSYMFAAGTSGYIELSNDADGYVIADAIRLEKPLVVDNTDSGFTVESGTWATSAISSGYYGADYRTSPAGTGSSAVRWTPTVPATGNYDVYVWYTASSNRATNAPYTIHHDGGSDTVHINQRLNGSRWVHLGTYEFTAGDSGYIELSDQANGFVIADAVKLEYTTGFFTDLGLISNLNHAMPSIIAVDDDTVTVAAQVRYTTTVPGGHFEKGAADIVTFRSTDQGETWGPMRYIYETSGVNGDSGYSSVFVKDGDKLLTVYTVGPQNWSPAQLVVHQRVSEDGGDTWDAPTTPTILNDHSEAKPTNGGKGYKHDNGRLIIPGRKTLLYSDDGGDTWTATPTFAGTVETKVQPHYDNGAMTDVALVPWRTNNPSHGTIDRVEIADSYAHLSSDNHSFASNNNFGFVRYDENTLLMTLTKTSNNSSRLYVRISTDEGLTWTNEKDITGNAPSARYSDIAVMPDGTIIVVFMQNNRSASNGSMLRAVKFDLDWVLR